MTAPNWFGYSESPQRIEFRRARNYAAEVALISSITDEEAQELHDWLAFAEAQDAGTDPATPADFVELEARHADWLDEKRTQEDARY